MSATAYTLIMGGAGVLVSLIVTFIFNGAINLPKKRRKQEAEQREKEVLLLNSIQKLQESVSDISKQLEYQRQKDEEFSKDIELIKLGLQSVLKNDLKTRYDYWIRRKYAPIDAKDDLERMYQVYHKLGANGVMDAHRERFLALPDSLPNQDSK